MTHRLETLHSNRVKMVQRLIRKVGPISVTSASNSLGIGYETMRRCFARMASVGDIVPADTAGGSRLYQLPVKSKASVYVMHDPAKHKDKVKRAIAEREKRVLASRGQHVAALERDYHGNGAV